MTYVEAQNLASKIYKSNNNSLSFDCTHHLDDSYRKSIESQESWIPCPDPNLSHFGYWSHGKNMGSGENGTMMWEWKQPHNENIVYLFTEKREKNEKGEYETINTVVYKHLVLTPEAIAFFSGINV